MAHKIFDDSVESALVEVFSFHGLKLQPKALPPI
jgi:hypothetical protein